MKARDLDAPGNVEDGRAPGGATGWRRHLAGLLVLLLAVGIGSAVRIHTALTDANFDTDSARPLLRSDPALLYYITERIIEAGGLPPDDFRADPRIEYPATSDLPAMFSICQEFVVAWCYLLFGHDVPLHVFCVWVMGVLASLAAVGVYGLALELTGRVRWAALAAGVYLILAGNYRTIGFILIREDFSVPCFAIHLFVLAWAVRVRTRIAFVLVAVTLVLAVCSWHAMSFVVTIEGACILAWFLRTGQNPLATRGAWLTPAVVALLAMVVPVLRSKLFVLSLPMQMMLAMLIAVPLERRWKCSRASTRIAALAALCVLLIVSVVVSEFFGGGLGDYSHVFALLKAKILHLGQMPADPSVIPFEARLLWEGAFQTASAGYFCGALGIGVILLLVAVGLGFNGWRTGRGEPRAMVLLAFVVAGGLSAYLVQRTIILPGLVTPVVAVVALRALRRRLLGVVLISCGLLCQVFLFGSWLRQHQIVWYHPPLRNAELAQLIGWIEKHVPPGEPIAADFVNSTAILAHTRHPILLQPKYETARSRRRIEEFLMTFVHGSPAEFRKLLERYQCRYLLIDRYYLWAGVRYITGTPPGQSRRPEPGTAAAVFCSGNPYTLASVPGYHLLYRSPQKFRSDLFRLYKLE